jgi:hypothetical protein
MSTGCWRAKLASNSRAVRQFDGHESRQPAGQIGRRAMLQSATSGHAGSSPDPAPPAGPGAAAGWSCAGRSAPRHLLAARPFARNRATAAFIGGHRRCGYIELVSASARATRCTYTGMYRPLYTHVATAIAEWGRPPARGGPRPGPARPRLR